MEQELILYPSLSLLAIAGIVIGVRIFRKVRHERRREAAIQCACQKLDGLAGRVLQAEAAAPEPDEIATLKGDLLRLSERRDLYYEQGGSLEEWEKLDGETDELSRRIARAQGSTCEQAGDCCRLPEPDRK